MWFFKLLLLISMIMTWIPKTKYAQRKSIEQDHKSSRVLMTEETKEEQEEEEGEELAA